MLKECSSVVAHRAPLSLGGAVGSRRVWWALSVHGLHLVLHECLHRRSGVAAIVVCMKVLDLDALRPAKSMVLLEASQHLAFAFVLHERHPIVARLEIMGAKHGGLSTMHVLDSELVDIVAHVVAWASWLRGVRV